MSRIIKYNGDELLERLGKYATPQEVADALKIKRGTVYCWRAEPNKYSTPKNLFWKFPAHHQRPMRRQIYVVVEVLKDWLHGKGARDESQSG